jgi:acyl carrier protein
MIMDEIQKSIVEYIVREYLEEDSDQEIGLDTPLITSGIVDSFSMVSLRTFLEKKHHVRIPDSRATPEAFETVRLISELLREHTAK